MLQLKTASLDQTPEKRVKMLLEQWEPPCFIFFLVPIILALLQKCQCECQTWIMRETSGTRTATRTEESVSTARIRRRAVGRSAVNAAVFCPLPVSNTRFIAAVIERHTHTPERRRRYWGRSGTESDHGKKRPP